MSQRKSGPVTGPQSIQRKQSDQDPLAVDGMPSQAKSSKRGRPKGAKNKIPAAGVSADGPATTIRLTASELARLNDARARTGLSNRQILLTALDTLEAWEKARADRE